MTMVANCSILSQFKAAGRFFFIHFFPFSAIISHSSSRSKNMPLNSTKARAVAHKSFPLDVSTAISFGHPVITASLLTLHSASNSSVRSQAPEACCSDINDEKSKRDDFVSVLELPSNGPAARKEPGSSQFVIFRHTGRQEYERCTLVPLNSGTFFKQSIVVDERWRRRDAKTRKDRDFTRGTIRFVKGPDTGSWFSLSTATIDVYFDTTFADLLTLTMADWPSSFSTPDISLSSSCLTWIKDFAAKPWRTVLELGSKTVSVVMAAVGVGNLIACSTFIPFVNVPCSLTTVCPSWIAFSEGFIRPYTTSLSPL